MKYLVGYFGCRMENKWEIVCERDDSGIRRNGLMWMELWYILNVELGEFVDGLNIGLEKG